MKKLFSIIFIVFFAVSCAVGGGIFLSGCSYSPPNDSEEEPGNENNDSNDIPDIEAEATNHKVYIYILTRTSSTSYTVSSTSASNAADKVGYFNFYMRDQNDKAYYTTPNSITYLLANGKSSSTDNVSYWNNSRYVYYYLYGSIATREGIGEISLYYNQESSSTYGLFGVTTSTSNSSATTQQSAGTVNYIYATSNVSTSESTALSGYNSALQGTYYCVFRQLHKHNFYLTSSSSATTVTSYAGLSTKTATASSRTGYTWGGSWVSADGSTSITCSSGSTASFTSNAATNWYGTWTPNTYTITLSASTADNSYTKSVTATYDSAMPSISTLPTRAGYTFKGYYTSSSGGTQYYTASGASAKTCDLTSNTKLYAQWTANTYAVTLSASNANNSYTTSVTATYGSAMPSISTLPTRTDYSFAGYYTASSGGTQYYTETGSSARTWDLSSDTTLYAQWTEGPYTITFNANGGTIASGSDWTGSGETATKVLEAYTSSGYRNYYREMPIPTRSGYIFGGWYQDSSYTTRVFYLTDILTSSHTLYADWIAEDCWTGAGTSTSPYLIASSSQLQVLERAVNAGNTFSGVYFQQVADIDCSDISSWVQIGMSYCYNSSSTAFGGIYNGDYNSISNLKEYGLFYEVTGGEIKNLGIVNCNITRSDSALVGYLENSTIANCYVTGVIDSGYAGGLVRGISASTISECYNAATITGSSSIGGIASIAYSGSVIENCYNIGSVSNGYEGAGGIVGWVSANSTDGKTVTISNCYNYGTITVPSGYTGGGIVGLSSGSYSLTIQHCYNVGEVTSKSTENCGGILGKISNSYVLTSNYYGGSCSSSLYGVASEGATNSNAVYSLTLASDATNPSWSLYSSYWDFDSVWTILSELNNGYPILKWQLEWCELTYNSNTGSSYTKEVYVGQDLTLETLGSGNAAWSRTGFTANGWNTSSTLTSSPTYASGASYTVTGDVMLYANWAPIAKSVTLGFKFYETSSWDTTARSGFSYKASYYTTTISSNTTTSTTATISSASTKTMRAGQTLTLNTITCPEGWTCVGYTSGSTTPSITASSAVTSVSPFLENNSAAITYYMCFKYVGLELKYDPVDKYFYFEDGEMPQTAVVTYNIGFNTILTNSYNPTGVSFESNGITFYIHTYDYSDADDTAYSGYDGERFLGFVMPSTRTIKLKNDGTTSRTFSAGTMYWFRFDPIRWRVSDYGVEITDAPSTWDLIGKTTENATVVSDVLWWDKINNDTQNKLGIGNDATQTSFMQSLISGNFFAGQDLKLESSVEKDIEVDSYLDSYTNQKVTTTSRSATTPVKMRYVRITSKGHTGDRANHLYYLKAYDTSGKEIVVADASKDTIKWLSGYYRDDGSYFDMGYSNELSFDLGKEMDIVSFHWYSFPNRKYYGKKIEYSLDNANWYEFWNSGNNGYWADENGDGTVEAIHDETGLYSEGTIGKTFTYGNMRYIRVTSNGYRSDSSGVSYKSNYLIHLKAHDINGNVIVLADTSDGTAKTSSYIQYNSTYFYTGYGKISTTFDIGYIANITSIDWYQFSGRTFYNKKIEYSIDGQTWHIFWDSGNATYWTDSDGDGTEEAVVDEMGLYSEGSTGRVITERMSLYLANLNEISTYQNELNCYASQLVAVLASRNQDKFFEYWTRDFGQQIGCGTYVTKSGETVTNSYWNTQKGVRFSNTLSRIGNTGVYLPENLYYLSNPVVSSSANVVIDQTTGFVDYSYTNTGTSKAWPTFHNRNFPENFDQYKNYLYVLEVTEFYSSTGKVLFYAGNTNSSSALTMLSYKPFTITETGVYSYIATGTHYESFTYFSREYMDCEAGQAIQIRFKIGLYEL